MPDIRTAMLVRKSKRRLDLPADLRADAHDWPEGDMATLLYHAADEIDKAWGQADADWFSGQIFGGIVGALAVMATLGFVLCLFH